MACLYVSYLQSQSEEMIEPVEIAHCLSHHKIGWVYHLVFMWIGLITYVMYHHNDPRPLKVTFVKDIHNSTLKIRLVFFQCYLIPL